MDKAKKTIEEAVKKAEELTHVGQPFLMMPSTNFPRIVGSRRALFLTICWLVD